MPWWHSCHVMCKISYHSPHYNLDESRMEYPTLNRSWNGPLLITRSFLIKSNCRVLRNTLGWTWWCHQMETFSALLAFCAGNSPVTGEFPAQRPVMRSFDAFFDLHLNKWLSKQSWGWWFEMPSRSLWCHCNDLNQYTHYFSWKCLRGD